MFVCFFIISMWGCAYIALPVDWRKIYSSRRSENVTFHHTCSAFQTLCIWFVFYCCLVPVITVTTSRWCLKSPAFRLFAQPFVQAYIKENTKARVTGLCEGNPSVTGGFSSQRASDVENVQRRSKRYSDDVSIYQNHHILVFPCIHPLPAIISLTNGGQLY